MFTQEELASLARFKLLMRQIHKTVVDLTLLSQDLAYRKQVLDQAENTDDENLLLLAIQLRARLGLLTALPLAEPAPPQPAEAASKSSETPSTEGRYTLSLR